MRCVLENRFRAKRHRHIVIGRSYQRDFSAGALDFKSTAHGRIEAYQAFPRGEAARDGEMTLDEFGLLFHVLGHKTPAIFLNNSGEGKQGSVVLLRIGTDEPSPVSRI